MQKRGSRLTRSSEDKAKKQIIYLIITILVVLVILFQFGPFLINSVGSFTSSFQTTKTGETKNDSTALEPPFITNIPTATTSAYISISGSAPYTDATIELFLNGFEEDSIPLTKEQDFTFSKIYLKEGKNTLKLRVKKGKDKSLFTDEYTVLYAKDDPKVEVSNPSDGQEFSTGDQSITVTGKTDSENTITVNGFRAIVDSEGNFSYYLKLNDGDNTVTVEATSLAGKKISKDIKVVYKP